jgi:hypothetical protein
LKGENDEAPATISNRDFSKAGEEEAVGAEIGVRYLLRERLVVDGGLGSESPGPATDRDCSSRQEFLSGS